jgi:hypothetical protein
VILWSAQVDSKDLNDFFKTLYEKFTIPEKTKLYRTILIDITTIKRYYSGIIHGVRETSYIDAEKLSLDGLVLLSDTVRDYYNYDSIEFNESRNRLIQLFKCLIGDNSFNLDHACKIDDIEKKLKDFGR